MEKLREQFLECWEVFKTAVLGKVPSPPECKDPVLIVMNSGLINLTNDQLVTLMILTIVHTSIESNYGADVAVSAALTQERVETLKLITALVSR